jgi:hypothetical protein
VSSNGDKARQCAPFGLTIAVIVLSCALGCEEKVPEPSRPAPAPSAAPTAEAPLFPYRFPPAERVVAIGDVHGDVEALRGALRLARAIDDTDRWIGGKLVVVQTGDQLDRGDAERKILDLLDALKTAAAQAGGALHALNGNHETMNVAGDFRYVTPGGFVEFEDLAPVKPSAELARLEPSMRGRAFAFAPGGPYAKRLADRNAVAIVGDTLFAHGGVLPEHVSYGIARINAEVARFIRGELPRLPAAIDGDQSPLWTRAYGAEVVDPTTCRMLDSVLGKLEVQRLVVGHTVQKAGISSACGDRVFRIDVGLSAYYGTAPLQVLEIAGGKTRVLTGERGPAKRPSPSPSPRTAPSPVAAPPP